MTKTALSFLFLVFLLCSCATNRHTVSQKTIIDSAKRASVFTELYLGSITATDNIDIILPKKYFTMPPISGTPSSETNESDTLKVRRRSTIITTAKDTTISCSTTTNTHHEAQEVSSEKHHNNAINTVSNHIRKGVIAIGLLIVLLLIWCPWRFNRQKTITG